MQIGNALRVAILLALYSFAGADVTAGAGSGTFCYWTSSGAQSRSHYSFLRLSANDARPRSLQLYHSVWTRDRDLVDCAVTDEPSVAERYLSLCREEKSENFTDVPETRFDVSMLFAPDNPCVDPFPAGVQASKRAKRQINDPVLTELHAGDGSEVKLRRQKRAWIIPGTVWCGSGNKADNYDDLGLFGQTDMCCREHDHCEDTIASFKFGYGIFNRHFFTVLHCNCEDRFRQCLLAANDTVSYMVGYGYFNLLRTPCFTLTKKMQCSQTNWFGMCTSSKMLPYAVLQEPMEYNATQPVPEATSGNVTVTSATPGTRNVTSDSMSQTPTTIPNVTQPVPKDEGFGNVIVPSATPGTRNVTSNSTSQTPTTIPNVTQPVPKDEGFGNITVPSATPATRNVTSDSTSQTPTTIPNVTQPVPKDEGFGNVTVPSATPGTRNITSDSMSQTPTTIPNITQPVPKDEGFGNVTVPSATPGTRNVTSNSTSQTPTTIPNVTQPVPKDEGFGNVTVLSATPGTRYVTSDSTSQTPTTIPNVTKLVPKDEGFGNVTVLSATPVTRNVTSDSTSQTPTTIPNVTHPVPKDEGFGNVTVPSATPATRNVTSDSTSQTPTTIPNVSHPVPKDEGFGNVTVPSATPGTRNVTSDSTSSKPTTVPNVPSPMAGTGQPPVRRPEPRPRCRPRGPGKGPVSRPGRRWGLRWRVCEEQLNSPLPPKGRDSDAQLVAVSTAGGGDTIAPPHQRSHPSSENALPTARPRTPQPVPHNQPAPMEDTRETEMLQPCDCYKHLDECRLKIPPLGERFGLKNPERKTLYHCNCTNRLAQQLQTLEEPDAVQSLLVDFVSPSCFLLAPPEECPGTAQGCPAVLSEASHLHLALSRRENGGKYYAETPILKVKRHNDRKSKRKRIPVKLYKKCMRIMDSKRSKRAEGAAVGLAVIVGGLSPDATTG